MKRLIYASAEDYNCMELNLAAKAAAKLQYRNYMSAIRTQKGD